jgi:Fe-S-cluster containining protein
MAGEQAMNEQKRPKQPIFPPEAKAPLSETWVNVDRWGFGQDPLPSLESLDKPEPQLQPVNELRSDVKPRRNRRPSGPHIPLRGRAPHEKLTDKQRAKLGARIASKVPDGFICKESCGRCCEQPLDITFGEWAKLEKLPIVKTIIEEHTANGDQIDVVPKTPAMARVGMHDNGHCPFLDDKTKQCRIYEHRPFSCRAYGQHWFARCAVGVECKPEQDASDKVMQEFGLIAQLPFGTMPLDRWEGTREVVEAWRRLQDVEIRRDQMPSFEEIVPVADKLLALVPIDSIAYDRLKKEIEALKTEHAAAHPKPKTEEQAPAAAPTSNTPEPAGVGVCADIQATTLWVSYIKGGLRTSDGPFSSREGADRYADEMRAQKHEHVVVGKEIYDGLPPEEQPS